MHHMGCLNSSLHPFLASKFHSEKFLTILQGFSAKI